MNLGMLMLSVSLLAQVLPPALSDAVVRPDDSPMVAAAKRSAVARRQAQGQAVWVIDDSMVGHRLPAGNAVQAGGAATARGELASTFSSYDPRPERQRAAERRQSLERERVRMAEESDQPYGGDVSEDAVEKRMNEIPRELEQLQAKPPR